MKIYTIGFTKKNAETFFELLQNHGIEKLVDIRLNPNGQLSGFAKKTDLPYFLSRLVESCQYVHLPELAPTKEILKDYRSNSDWEQYETRFETLMDERRFSENMNRTDFEDEVSCLLCSESTPENCHRRLIAERMARNWRDVEIIHL
jgi:uncharacterized protein (DUF488 family)